jgi:hypothetical protein
MSGPHQQVQGHFPPAVSQTPQSATQSQFSPVVRQWTPMAASAVSMQQTPQPQNMSTNQMQALQHQHMQQRLRMQQMQNMSPGNSFQQLAMQKAAMHIQQQGVPQGQNPTIYQQHLARLYFSQMQQAQQQKAGQQPSQQLQNTTAMSPQGSQSSMSNQQGAGLANLSVQQLRQHYQQRKAQLLQTFGQNVPQHHVQQMHQLELHIKTREQQTGQKPGQQPQNMTAMSPQGSQSGMSNQQGAGLVNVTPNQTNETAPRKKDTKGKKVQLRAPHSSPSSVNTDSRSPQKATSATPARRNAASSRPFPGTIPAGTPNTYDPDSWPCRRDMASSLFMSECFRDATVEVPRINKTNQM